MKILSKFLALQAILISLILMLFILFVSPLSYANTSNKTENDAETALETDVIRAAIEDVDANSRFLIYYGDDYYLKDAQGKPLIDKDKRWILNSETMDKLLQFDVIVLQPNQPHCTPEVVDYLQDHGVDYVLGYISIGEQSATTAQKGDGSGPLRYDAVSKLLKPSNQGFASFYMDVDTQSIRKKTATQTEQIVTSKAKIPDGRPDINPKFAGYMIYPDAAWRTHIKQMRIGKASAQAGLDQLILDPDDSLALNQKRDQNFGFDGFFLDTIDTAGPYDGLGWYPWALEAMRDTVKFISDSYPNKVVFANRGGFYFQAGLQSTLTQQYPIDFSIRPYVNAFLFESYIYDSDPKFDGIDQQSEYYYDNRYNQMPKIIAEAQRDDGFSVFILEYDSGRSKTVDNFMTRIINEDIAMWGATTYIAENGRLNTINTALLPYLPHTKPNKPQWKSTAYQYMGQKPPTTPLTQTGINHIRSGQSTDEVIVNWDVVAAQYLPVTYHLYWSKQADIKTAKIIMINTEDLQSAKHYLHKPTTYAPYEMTLSNMSAGTYYFWIIAKDSVGNSTEKSAMRHFSINPAVDLSLKNNPNAAENAANYQRRFAESRPKSRPKSRSERRADKP
jgi:hypothetical protein